MFIAALLVGLMVAYYFGVRPGMIAAGATAGLFLLAAVMPGAAAYAYVVVCAGVAGVIWLGPRLKRPDALASSVGGLGGGAVRVVGSIRRAVKRFTGNGQDQGPKKGGKRRAGW